jgi:hypothetical protein
VQYVFVPQANLQSSAANEPRTLAGSSQFVRVARADRWIVYRVIDPRPIVTPMPRPGRSLPAADVVSYGRAELTVRIPHAGNYVAKVSWSPYWTLARGAGSLSQAPGGWVCIHAAGIGVYELRFTVTADGIFDQLL